VVNYVERFIRPRRRTIVLIDLFVDGGTKLNCTCLIDPQRKKKFIKKLCEEHTNNELEYRAILNAIEYSRKIHPKEKITIKSDSMLAVKQINGHWNVTGENLIKLKQRADNRKTKMITVEWIPREYNLAGVYLEGLADR
jgi:ribonuclease HI